ncbi:unnamed protein product [Brachionus calyciflorus]|uniref:Uncharacterized protein n=1 Tax=Brachionus calyciflorus TaxID=104777 RepID=A0A814KL67_9BILA|nr:unnamed protein product [Brachionus calyciflorus]
MKKNQSILSNINKQKVSRQIQFTTRSAIINYHDEVVNKLDIIFETALSSLNSNEHQKEIEKLNHDRSIILDEIQKVKDENLREENIGKKFKYCFVIEKIFDKTATLIIANFDHNFVEYEPTFRFFKKSINNLEFGDQCLFSKILKG